MSFVSERHYNSQSALTTDQNDLRNPEVFDQELWRWKAHWQGTWPTLPDKNQPTTLAQTMKQVDKLEYPNIYTLLQIGCTVPVTSCECERSASALKRLHHYNRVCMTQDRLSACALMYIHHDVHQR